MKTVGLLGGMSFESTVTYYQEINRGVNQRLGGLHSAKLLLASVDFEEIAVFQRQGRWDEAAAVLVDAGTRLASAGAEAMLICTNTMHKVAGEIEASLSIPLIHIVDPTGEALGRQGRKQVGLLGTRFTMQDDFYRDRLQNRFGILAMTPPIPEQDELHRIIFDELCKGIIRPESRQVLVEAATALGERGAEAVILGCTEVGLLLSQDDVQVPLLDTTRLHADAAVEFMLGGESAR